MSKATQQDLARRIRTAQPVDKAGRYDTASKVEVKAFVKEEVERIEFEIGLIPRLEARIAELELSLWARIKRWFSQLGKAKTITVVAKSTTSLGKTELLGGEDLMRALRAASDKAGRTVGKPPEFAEPYGKPGVAEAKKQGVEIKQGEGLQVKLPIAR